MQDYGKTYLKLYLTVKDNFFFGMYIYMFPKEYFEGILKHKRYFNNSEISLMTPSQIRAYRITGHIRRNNSIKYTNYLKNLVKKQK